MAGVKVKFKWHIFMDDQNMVNFDQNNIYKSSNDNEDDDNSNFIIQPFEGQF